MSARQGLGRKAHFVGTKIRSLRKRNNLTLEDLSVRCVQIDADAGREEQRYPAGAVLITIQSAACATCAGGPAASRGAAATRAACHGQRGHCEDREANAHRKSNKRRTSVHGADSLSALEPKRESQAPFGT